MPVELVKLTAADYTTSNDTKWVIGETVKVRPVPAPRLCTPDVLHAYRTVEQALLLNPAHGAYLDDAPMFSATSTAVVIEDATKVGVYDLTLTALIDRPKWFTNLECRKRVQVRFAVLCARAVLPVFESARPDDMRPRRAIEAAEVWLSTSSLSNAAYAAADAADAAAANAYAAAYAAYAAYAAADAAAVAVANAAADAAADAAYAANAATAAADATLDIVKLAREAVAAEYQEVM